MTLTTRELNALLGALGRAARLAYDDAAWELGEMTADVVNAVNGHRTDANAWLYV